MAYRYVHPLPGESEREGIQRVILASTKNRTSFAIAVVAENVRTYISTHNLVRNKAKCKRNI